MGGGGRERPTLNHILVNRYLLGGSWVGFSRVRSMVSVLSYTHPKTLHP